MFASCADPSSLQGLSWLMCYLTSGKHLLFYSSFGTVLLLLAVTAPVALLFGFGGAMASRSHFAPLRWFGKTYTAMVRGIPDIVFFLFVPIALDQGFEWLRNKALCDSDAPVRQGNDFVVCAAAKLPLSTSPPGSTTSMPSFWPSLPFPSSSGPSRRMCFTARCRPCRARSWKRPRPMA